MEAISDVLGSTSVSMSTCSPASDEYKPSRSPSPDPERSRQRERKSLIDIVRRSTKGENSCGRFSHEQYIRILEFLKKDKLDYPMEEPHERAEIIAFAQRRLESAGSGASEGNGSFSASDVKSLRWILEVPSLEPYQRADMNQTLL